MEIIAKTNSGVMIQATEAEVKEIINAVTGKKPEKIEIGQKIPAIDYASTITKIKTLSSDYNFTELLNRSKQFIDKVSELKETVDNAKNIEV